MSSLPKKHAAVKTTSFSSTSNYHNHCDSKNSQNANDTNKNSNGKKELSGLHYEFAISTMQGRRNSQEDSYAIGMDLSYNESTCSQTLCPGSEQSKHSKLGKIGYMIDESHDKNCISLPCHALFAVFDGHGTAFASNFVATHFIPTFCRQSSFAKYCQLFLIGNGQTPKGEKKKRRSDKKSGTRLSNSSSGAASSGETSRELNALLEDALKQAMIELDAKLLTEMISKSDSNHEGSHFNCNKDDLFELFDSGTTAIVVCITPHHIVCANLGDSRSILVRGTSKVGYKSNEKSSVNIETLDEDTCLICMSNDHKPNVESEGIRIRNAGGSIISGKIEGRLAVSRGLGDFEFKNKNSVLLAMPTNNANANNQIMIKPENQMVTSVPEIVSIERDLSQDKFLILASDGLWDVLNNEKCAHLVTDVFSEGETDLGLACEELLDQCFAKGALDNMTAVLIRFPAQTIGNGGGVIKRRKQRMGQR